MTPLICEESWLDWPAKHWSECFSYEITEVFPNWIISLATGDATIGSYLIAAVVGFLGLTVLGIIIAIIAEAIVYPIAEWYRISTRPKPSTPTTKGESPHLNKEAPDPEEDK